MCGIAGFVSSRSRPWPEIDEILRCLEHRGPDDLGWAALNNGNVQAGRQAQKGLVAEALLIHRRLSILDLSAAGHQPMESKDGRFWVIYNGEIYNYIELRRELAALGHQFSSNSDTEVLLAAYAQWGLKCLVKLTGMFAFALLDIRARKLFLARDFFGIKPLYYSRDANSMAFASEIKALLLGSGTSRKVNPERLFAYLRYGQTDDSAQTLFQNIRQLLPGHFLEISLDRPDAGEPECYWKPTLGDRLDLSFDEAAVELRRIFLQNVDLHLRSDVPIGAALSGGIDSSSIVEAMRHVAGPKLELHTFSYIAEDAALSEEKWVDRVASRAGAHNHKVFLAADQLKEDLEHLMLSHDEPFASTSIFAQFAVFREAARVGVKVMLDGQGADEILAGYRTCLPARLASLVRQQDWSEGLRFFRAATALPGASKSAILLHAMRNFVPDQLQELGQKICRQESFPDWLRESWFRKAGVSGGMPGRPLKGKRMLKEQLCQILTEVSLPHLLRYEDRDSMAFSIESRVPFLTPNLVDFVFSLPEEYILGQDGTTKAVFRQAMQGIVDPSILSRRDKIGFATTEADWIRKLQPWVRETLESEEAKAIPALNWKAVRAQLDGFLKGQKAYHSRIWRWINLVHWSRQFQVVYS